VFGISAARHRPYLRACLRYLLSCGLRNLHGLVRHLVRDMAALILASLAALTPNAKLVPPLVEAALITTRRPSLLFSGAMVEADIGGRLM
jgi:hypothetical protein